MSAVVLSYLRGISFVETESPRAQAGLELATELRINLEPLPPILDPSDTPTPWGGGEVEHSLTLEEWTT